MAIRITRVYTRRGDRGETDLVGGPRVPKDSPRIDAYGTVDELNAAVGLARAENAAAPERRAAASRRLDGILKRLQNELFDLGGELATPREAFHEGMFRVGAAEVQALESLLDACQKDLRPLQSFVLPGGGIVSAQLHVARTVCRRAERDILRLMRHEDVGEWPLAYVNRLSDLLFVLSRWIGHHLGEAEFLWERPLQREAEQRARRQTGQPGTREVGASEARPRRSRPAPPPNPPPKPEAGRQSGQPGTRDVSASEARRRRSRPAPPPKPSPTPEAGRESGRPGRRGLGASEERSRRSRRAPHGPPGETR